MADQALEKLTGMLDNFPVFVLSDEHIWNNKDITTERLLHYKEKACRGRSRYEDYRISAQTGSADPVLLGTAGEGVYEYLFQ